MYESLGQSAISCSVDHWLLAIGFFIHVYILTSF